MCAWLMPTTPKRRRAAFRARGMVRGIAGRLTGRAVAAAMPATAPAPAVTSSLRVRFAIRPPESFVCWALALYLEAEAERVGVADIDQYSMLKHVPSNQTLDMLVLERGGDSGGFDDHIVRQDEPKQIDRAQKISRRWRVYRDDTYRIQPEVWWQGVSYYRGGRSGIDHRDRGNRSWHGLFLALEEVLEDGADGELNFDDRTLRQQVRELGSKRGQLNAQEIGREVLRSLHF